MWLLNTSEFYSLWFGISGVLIWVLFMAYMPILAVSSSEENKKYRSELFFGSLLYIAIAFVLSFLLLKFDLIHFGTR